MRPSPSVVRVLLKSSHLEMYGVLFLLVILLFPHSIYHESLLGGSQWSLLALLWDLLITSSGFEVFMPPLGLTLHTFILWIWGFLYLVIVLHSARKGGGISTKSYIVRIGFVLLLQILTFPTYLMSLPPGPPRMLIPLPLPAIIAFLLTPKIAGKQSGLWHEESTTTD
jgi:hypothetical protein